MATTPLNVSLSDSKPQTEAQGAGIEMQARLPAVDSDDALVGRSDAAAGLVDAQVQPSVSVASPGPTPSDAAEAEKRMLDAIDGALEQGPRAVVEAMWMALPRGKAYDEIFKFKSSFEELPISAACAMGQSLAVISKLMQAFPDHVGIKDKDGWTVMHWAARNNPNVAVISELLKTYPEAACEKVEDGPLPVHLTTWNDSNVAVILELLKAYPEAARQKNKNGLLLLHQAVWTGQNLSCNTAVILELLKAYPEAAREKYKDGTLPLHRAIQMAWSKPPAAVISELLKVYPEAAREKNDDGLLPLHVVVDCDYNAAVISEVLKVYPEAVFEVNAIFNRFRIYDKKALFDKCLSALSQAGGLPCSMIKNSVHPLRACLRLSADLMAFSRSQRSNDIRLANDADEKAAELEQLACAIARSCVDSSLFGQEMDDCLQLAADTKLKFFVSEPVCCRRIERLWLTNGIFKERFFSFFLSLGFSLLWISGLSFVFNIPDLSPPPLVRFLMNRASYLAFLVCLLQLPVLPAPGHPVNNIGLEVFLAYWLLDICFAEAAELLDIMKKHRLTAFKAVAKYAEDPWNVYDVVALSAAVAAAVVRGVVYAGVSDATAAASNQLYAWALALLWGRLVNVLSVVSFIGPLLIMVLAMVFRDLSKFAFLVVLMELPFVAALYFLESGDGGNEAFATFPDSALSFFKIVIGQGPDVSSVTASSSVLLSVGSVLLSVLLLNLLIAMFSKTFDTIVENSTQEYLLQKAQLTFTWARAPRMPPPFACALALRDWVMNMVARHVWQNGTFRVCFAGWDEVSNLDGPDYAVELVEPPPPTFDKKHFYEIVFSKEIDYKHIAHNTKQEHKKNPAKREEWNAQWMQECEAKYEAWCEKVLADLEENAEFNSEAQMDKFKSRMLRGMETTVESSGKIDQIAENAKAAQEQVNLIQEQGKATQEQVKALSEALQSQQAQIQHIHTSVQRILQKLNS